MKKTVMLCLSLIVLTISSLAQKGKKTTPILVKDSFEVNGVCGMCKTNIEKAAKRAGATFAIWSEETHQLLVTYSNAKTNVAKMQKQIAVAGYDNAGATSTENAYDKLHGCCKYDRKKMEEKVITNQ
jgi:periplasmic mercuric ion binding protein